MLVQITFGHESALFEDAYRSVVERKDVGGDFRELQLLERVAANGRNDGCHDTLPPERLGQPVPDFGSMGLARSDVQADPADQVFLAIANRPIGAGPLGFFTLLYNPQPLLGIGLGIWIRNAQRAVVDFLLG